MYEVPRGDNNVIMLKPQAWTSSDDNDEENNVDASPYAPPRLSVGQHEDDDGNDNNGNAMHKSEVRDVYYSIPKVSEADDDTGASENGVSQDGYLVPQNNQLYYSSPQHRRTEDDDAIA